MWRLEIGTIAKQLLAQRPRAIGGGIGATPLQLRHDVTHDVLEGVGRHCIGDVEAVDVGLIDPFLQRVGDLRWRSHEDRSQPADAAELGELVHRPRLVTAGEVLDHRDDGVGLDLLHLVLRRILPEVDATPARHEDQRAVIGNVVRVVVELCLGLGRRLVGDDGDERVDQDLAGVAARRCGTTADVLHIGLQYRLGGRGHEHALGVPRSEVLPRTRGACLIKNRCPLWRGFGELIARHVEILALVPDLMNFLGVGEDATVTVADDGTLFPAAFQQLVENLDIFGGDVIAVVVAPEPALADVLRTTLQIGGDDVPADASLCVMVRRRDTPGECVGMLEGRGRSDADAEMLGRKRNGSRQLQRVIHRDLGCLLDRVIVGALVDIVVANDVGDEDAVEDAAFERAGHILPVVEILVLPGLVLRMRPQARRLVADAVHVEGVEVDLTRHAGLLRSLSGEAAATATAVHCATVTGGASID